MMKLGINIDHAATLRQARRMSYPDLIQAAMFAIKGGADKITLHLREDRRHIQDDDVWELKKILTVPMNLELSVNDDILSIAESVKPEYCCLVPEKREELTTEGGLDVVSQFEIIRQACRRLSQAGCKVSLFIDTDLSQIDAAIACNASAIEIHTGRYANATDPESRQMHLDEIAKAAHYAKKKGLIVNAGHGLTLENVEQIAALSDIEELNIGHSIIARAIFIGLTEAVREMKALLQK